MAATEEEEAAAGQQQQQRGRLGTRSVGPPRPAPPPPKRQGGGGSCSPLFCTYELLGNKQLRGKLTQEEGEGKDEGEPLGKKEKERGSQG